MRKSTRSLLGLAVSAQASSRANGEPEAFGRCAIGGLVAVDQSEARLAFMAFAVETDTAAIDKLGMSTCAHKFSGVRIRLALQEQLCDPTLQRVDFGTAG